MQRGWAMQAEATVGDDDGAADEVLGLVEGLVVGIALGLCDGLRDGLSDGDTDGNAIGDKLGLALGLDVGDCDGLALGLLGLAPGSGVGGSHVAASTATSSPGSARAYRRTSRSAPSK